ncbi:MAG TPA: MFS transporter [Ktedonobacterales bacterium]
MTSDASSKRIGPFTPLRHRSFSLLFSGQLTSALGDQVFALALPWTVIAVTGDPVQVAVVLAAEAIPRVLLLPIGGALSDRINPRIVMLLSDIGRAGVVGALGVTLLSGLPPLWVVALLAALQGVGSGLFLPGSQAILPRTVKNADIPAANGLMQIILWLTMVVGPVLGGVAVAVQAAIAFLVDAASFAVSAITLASIRLSAPDTPAAKAAALIDEQTVLQPAGTTERIEPTEETAPTGAPVLLLTTSPRLATVQFMVEEVEVEGAPSDHAAPTEPPPHDESAAEDTVVAEVHAVDEAEEHAEDASLESLAAEQSAPEDSDSSPPPIASTQSEAKPEPQPQRARPGVLNEIRAGMAFTFGQPLMRTAMLVSILGNLAFTGTFGIALIVLSRNLDPSPVTLGLLLGACGVGGVLGSLAAGPTGRRRRRSLLTLLLWLIMPVALALVPIYAGAAAALPFPIDLSAANFGDVTLGSVDLGVLNLGDQVASMTAPQRLLAVAILLGLVSCIIALGETIFITIIQQRTPPEFMARVFSVQFMAAGVTQPLSLVATGFILSAWGVGVAFLATAALFFIAAVIGLASSAMRRA